MGKRYLEFMEHSKIYLCKHCSTQLSAHKFLVSKNFSGKFGRAFLMDSVINAVFQPAQEETLMTGLHIISEMNCKSCKAIIGWRYIKAYQPTQKYKEGKFILERNQVFKSEWD